MGARTEAGLTTVEGGGVVDISRHEGRFRLLPNRVVPHPADPTLEEGAQSSELQEEDNKLNIETPRVDCVTQQDACDQNCVARSNLQNNNRQTCQTTAGLHRHVRFHEKH